MINATTIRLSLLVLFAFLFGPITMGQELSPKEQCLLGQRYENGEGVPKNTARAVELYRKAAERGDCIAQFSLGQCYEFSKGVEQNLPEAFKWYLKAAEGGAVQAFLNVAVRYHQGDGPRKNIHEAIKWYSLVLAFPVDKSEVKALCNLGFIYSTGDGVPQDNVVAIQFLNKAARLGSADAQRAMGYMCENGLGLKAPDLTQAVQFYTLAAGQGDAQAMCSLAYFYYHGIAVLKNVTEATRLLKSAAELGNPQAVERLKELGVEKTK